MAVALLGCLAIAPPVHTSELVGVFQLVKLLLSTILM